MENKYHSLRTTTLGQNITYCRPASETQNVTCEDSAIKVMTDLRIIKAVTTRPDTMLEDCNQHMIRNNVRLLLVTNEQRIVLGIITATDILGEKPMLHIQKAGGTRNDIQVSHIMTPSTNLKALSLDNVEMAKVGDIVEDLIDMGQHHALVICDNPDQSSLMICGIFSATQIGKQIGVPIEPADIAKTFAELKKVIAA